MQRLVDRPSSSSRFHVLDEDVRERNLTEQEELSEAKPGEVDDTQYHLQKKLLSSHSHAVLYSYGVIITIVIYLFYKISYILGFILKKSKDIFLSMFFIVLYTLYIKLCCSCVYSFLAVPSSTVRGHALYGRMQRLLEE